MTRTAATLTAAALATFLSFSAEARTKHTQPQATDLTPSFRAAGLPVERIQVFEVGGIVVIRGRAAAASTAEAVGRYATQLGYTRVANLVQIVPPPDDAAIERAAERELTIHRGLDGCKFRVDADAGIVTIAGSVRQELQKDMAIALVRSVDGVREVRATLDRE